VGCCEHGDEPSGSGVSGVTSLVRIRSTVCIG
jgi:hypothetical protein